MADIIPFPTRMQARGYGLSQASSTTITRVGVSAQVAAKVNALGRNFFWVINHNIPQNSAELARIIGELEAAISNISRSLGGAQQVASQYCGGVRVFLSQAKLEWRPDRFDVPELFVPNTTEAHELEDFIRRHAARAA
jgi:hypothetical protein